MEPALGCADDRCMRKGFAALVLVLAGSCDGGDEVVVLPDAGTAAWGPIDYEARVYPQGGSLGALQARIDGQLTDVAALQFVDPVSFTNARIRVELVDGQTVVDSLVLDPARDSASCPYNGGAAEIHHQVCGYDHGELRLFAIDLRDSASGCVGDWFCLPRCDQYTCGAGTKCGSSFASADLRFSRVDCVPAGDRLVGDACTWSEGAGGRFVDNCVTGSMCVEGVCRAQCIDGACPSGTACTRIPGHSAEIPACVANVLRP